jgi:hypothetical protein
VVVIESLSAGGGATGHVHVFVLDGNDNWKLQDLAPWAGRWIFQTNEEGLFMESRLVSVVVLTLCTFVGVTIEERNC